MSRRRGSTPRARPRARRPEGADGRPHDGADHPLAAPGRDRRSRPWSSRRADRPPRPRGRADGLPLDRLLDPAEMHAVVARALGERGAARRRGGRAASSTSRATRWPSTTARSSTARRDDVVATSIAGVDLAARAASRPTPSCAPGRRARARGEPVSYDRRLDALVTWLPFDPGCPRWREDGPELAAPRSATPRRARAGADRLQAAARAVLRAGRSRAEGIWTRRAVRGRAERPRDRLRRGAAAHAPLRRRGARPAPDRAGARRRAPPETAAAAAAAAGALVADLQRAQVAGLSPATPERHLEAAARKADLIGTVMPGLRAAPRRAPRCASRRPADRRSGACPRTATSTSTSCWTARAASRSSTSTRCASRRPRSTSRHTRPTSCAAATRTWTRCTRSSTRCSAATAAAGGARLAPLRGDPRPRSASVPPTGAALARARRRDGRGGGGGACLGRSSPAAPASSART